MCRPNYILFIFAIIILNIKTLSAQWWTSTENFGWEINNLEIVGKNVLATSENGLFISSDYGKQWMRITIGFPADYATGVLAVNNDTILLEIHKPNSAIVNMYRSIDDGFTWTKLDFDFENGFSSIAFIGKNIFAGSYNGGMYISPDNGASWALHNEGFPKDSSGYLMIPFAMAVQGTKLFAGIGFDYQNCGLFMSADSGRSWIETGIMGFHITDLLVCKDEKGDTNIIALSLNRNYDDGVYIGNTLLSNDGGTTWTKIDSGVTETWPLSIAAIQNESGGTNLFMGTWGDGLYFTNDWGENWSSAGLPYNDIRSLATGFTEDGTSILFAGNSGQWHTHGTGGSIFFSADNGTHWFGSAINTYINTLAVSPNGSGGSNMYAVASNVFMSSTDNGESWTISGLPAPEFSALAVSPVSSGKHGTDLFIGVSLEGVYYSTDNGVSWMATDSLGGEFTSISFLSVTENIAGDTILFAGTNEGAFFSKSKGTNWIAIPGLSYKVISSHILFKQKEYVGTLNEGVFLSGADGSSWNRANTGLTNLNIRTFVICDSILFAGTEKGVFRYNIADTTWSAAGLAGKDVNAFVVIDSSLFAGTSGTGVFLSNDFGVTWQPVNSGLANLVINAFAINGNDLFAATSKGIWQRSIHEMITIVEEEIEIPARYRLLQNYPNPFNPETVINYQIGSVGTQHAVSLLQVNLSVYNLLGEKVATLVNKYQQAGRYSVTFNASHLASGVYVYTLVIKDSPGRTSSGFRQSRKFVLIK